MDKDNLGVAFLPNNRLKASTSEEPPLILLTILWKNYSEKRVRSGKRALYKICIYGLTNNVIFRGRFAPKIRFQEVFRCVPFLFNPINIFNHDITPQIGKNLSSIFTFRAIFKIFKIEWVFCESGRFIHLCVCNYHLWVRVIQKMIRATLISEDRN